MSWRSRGKVLLYVPFIGAGLFVLGGWLWAWRVLQVIESPLILHFSDYTGINQIGSMADIHGLAATGVVIIVLDLFLAMGLQKAQPRWAGLLAWVTLLLGILLFTALAAIISVNQ